MWGHSLNIGILSGLNMGILSGLNMGILRTLGGGGGVTFFLAEFGKEATKLNNSTMYFLWCLFIGPVN